MSHLEVAPTSPSITTLAPIHDTREPVSTASPNLWERIAIACRVKHYSLSTERTYDLRQPERFGAGAEVRLSAGR